MKIYPKRSRLWSRDPFWNFGNT